MGRCSVDECEKPSRARGLCSAHYKRYMRGADLKAPIRVAKGQRIYDSCTVPGCGRTHASKGFCNAHYKRSLKGSSLTEPLSGAQVVCKVPGCGKPFKAKGFCNGHYSRHKEGKPTDTILEEYLPRTHETCIVEICEKKPIAKNLCRKHLRWDRTYGIRDIERLNEFSLRVCEICASPDDLHIDHDHTCCKGPYTTCGKCVRGVLCGRCNRALGLLRENPDLLLKGVDYLRKSR